VPINDLRRQAIDAFNVGVSAADPETGMKQAFARASLAPLSDGEYFVIAVGKAACKMAKSAIEHLPPGAKFSATAVTNYENEDVVNRCRVLSAGHPVPDENGYRAAKFVMAELARATANDCVIVCVSGGSSALLPAPVAGVTFDDKVNVNDLLLASGLDITQMNLVRQNLSDLKGGGMLRRAQPAKVISYILSDVVGDDLRVVGSGPTLPAIGGKSEARDLLTKTGLYPQLPQSVRDHLEAEADLTDRLVEHKPILIGGNSVSAAAMAQAATAVLDSTPLEGLVDQAAKKVADTIAKTCKRNSGPIALAFGGETTVMLTGSGKGGRNQELSLRVAQLLAEVTFVRNWCFLSGGTDGRDGPTDAAGGLVDCGTLGRIAKRGGDISKLLSNNDSYKALAMSGDLLMTGATGTNVADLQLFLCDGSL
jgi:glycerate 2-kinase